MAQASENLPSAMRRSVRFVAVLPTVMHTVVVSEGGGGTITDAEEPGQGGSRGKEGSLQEDFLPLARPRSDPGQGGIRGKEDASSDPDSAHPFALVELAVCMHGVLRRRGHLTHLDGVQSSETSKVASIFYRYYAGAHGRQQLRRLLEHELPCQVIGVPWLQPGAAGVSPPSIAGQRLLLHAAAHAAQASHAAHAPHAAPLLAIAAPPEALAPAVLQAMLQAALLPDLLTAVLLLALPAVLVPILLTVRMAAAAAAVREACSPPP